MRHPYAPVNTLRNAVATQLAERLPELPVLAASMERREDPQYDFNEPLLERVDQTEGFAGGCLIAAMFFCSQAVMPAMVEMWRKFAKACVSAVRIKRSYARHFLARIRCWWKSWPTV